VRVPKLPGLHRKPEVDLEKRNLCPNNFVPPYGFQNLRATWEQTMANTAQSSGVREENARGQLSVSSHASGAVGNSNLPGLV
jgi:hypothetical protein